jgi:hypothetical protein
MPGQAAAKVNCENITELVVPSTRYRVLDGKSRRSCKGSGRSMPRGKRCGTDLPRGCRRTPVTLMDPAGTVFPMATAEAGIGGRSAAKPNHSRRRRIGAEEPLQRLRARYRALSVEAHRWLVRCFRRSR